MGLPLHDVAPREGWRWILRGLLLWRSRPLVFIGMVLAFVLGTLSLAATVPVLGGLAAAALWPMLTLGMSIAARSAAAGGPVHVLQFIEGLRHPDPARRRAQWWLCGSFAVVSAAVMLLWSWVDGGTMGDLFKALGEPLSDQRNAEINALLADRRLVGGVLTMVVLSGITAVPYWYASALVHWGGQSTRQALFSSGLAVWRTRGAFLVNGLGWLLLGMLPLALVLRLAAMLLSPVLSGPLAFTATLAIWAVFYLSQWFAYVDTFGEPGPDASSGGPKPAA